MHPYMYEQQAKIKLNDRFKEGREWRKWRIAHPAGRGLIVRVVGVLSSTFRRIPRALRGRAQRVLEVPPSAISDVRVEAPQPRHAR